jgi:hypothetical protein
MLRPAPIEADLLVTVCGGLLLFSVLAAKQREQNSSETNGARTPPRREAR